MKTFMINYLAPNPKANGNNLVPVCIHKVATYHANTEEEAIAKFEKYHTGKRHTFQFVWEETDIGDTIINLRSFLTDKLMPKH